MSANPANPALSTGLKPGDKLDKYDVLEQIGAGGMSIVWKGYDGLLDQYVAIKQVTPDAAGAGRDEEDFRERFRQEATLQKRVAGNHKHLVKVIDVIEEQRGLFLIMEFVDGQSLEQLLEQNAGPIESRQALGIVAATAVALDEIHKHGIVHRDLKPSNILLPTDGGLKVCDFGLAAVMSEQGAPSAGSVRYMAPELFREEQVDARADIYALGMIAYEMLAGRPDFKDAFKVVLRDQRNQALRWMKWHTNERVNAPALNERNSDIPPTLAELVARMMEKDPGKRIASAQELLAAIKRHFSGKSAAPAAGRPVAAGVPGGSQAPIAPAEKTAALPTRKGMNPAVKVLIFSAAAMVMFGISFFAISALTDANTKKAEEQALMQKATDIRGKASKAHKEQRWMTSRKHWQELQDLVPDHPKYSAEATAGINFAAANLHYQGRRYQDALAALKAADDEGVIPREQVYALEKDITHRQAFDLGFSAAQEQVDKGDYRFARDKLYRLERTAQLKPDETERIRDLGARIEQLRRQRAILAELAAAKAELEAEREPPLPLATRRARAIAVLKEALTKYSDHRLEDMLAQLQDDVTFAAATAAAGRLKAQGDSAIPQTIAAYQKLKELRDDPTYDQQINLLRSRQAYLAGKALEDGGNPTAAVAKYKEARTFAENDDARLAIARIEKLSELQSYINSGDGAFAAENYPTAIAHYKKAQSLGAGPEIQAKIDQANVFIALADAERHLRAGEFDKSFEALARVEALDPNNSRAAALKQAAETWKAYITIRDRGDALRKQGELGRAIVEYRNARKIQATKEINQRLNDTEYESLVAQARRDMESRNYKAARGMLETALRAKQTEEAQDLLNLVLIELGEKKTVTP